jgi:hypothetical protein
MDWYRVTHVSFHSGRWMIYADQSVDIPDCDILGIPAPGKDQTVYWRDMRWRATMISNADNRYGKPTANRIVFLPEFPSERTEEQLRELLAYKRTLFKLSDEEQWNKTP